MPSSTLQLGPLALPIEALLVALAIGLGVWLSERMARTRGIDIRHASWAVLLGGVVCARLVFILQWRETYLADPVSVFDLRDGGWEPLAGVVAGLGIGLTLARRRPALRKPVLAGVLLTAAVLAAGAGFSAIHAPVQARLPALTLHTLDGMPVALDRYTGKPTVLNLWASWCGPCRREMPVLQQAQASRSDIQVVFVNQGESAMQVQRYLAGLGARFDQVLLDPRRQAGRALAQSALPVTVFFDAQGRWVSTRIGELSTATLAQRIAQAQRSSTAR